MPPCESRWVNPYLNRGDASVPPLRPKARLVLRTSVRADRGARHEPHMQRSLEQYETTASKATTATSNTDCDPCEGYELTAPLE